MKSPQPDIGKVAVDLFIAKSGANRKFLGLWGTVNINGQDVLNSRRHYHKKSARPENYERLFKFLKVYNDLDDYDGEGIKSAWFEINKSLGPEDLAAPETFIKDNLNTMWWDYNDGALPEDLTLTTSIVIGQRFDGTVGQSVVDWEATEEEKIQSIKDNYESLWGTHRITQEGVGVINKGIIVDEVYKTEVPDEDDLSPDDPWLSLISRYALRDSGIPCEIKSVESGIGYIKGHSIYSSVVVTLEIPYYLFTTEDPLVQQLYTDSNTAKTTMANLRKTLLAGHVGYNKTSNEQISKASVQFKTYFDEDFVEDFDEETVTRQYLDWEDFTPESIYEDYWIKFEGDWYLKADVIRNPRLYGTTHVKLNDYLFSLLDTGYKKEKTPLWKKVVAVVVFVIAVVLAFYTSGGTLSWASAAAAILAGSLVVNLIILVASAIGAEEWASAFAWLNREIDPLVTVATIILIVTAFVKKGIEAVVKEVALEFAEDYIFEEILGEFGDLGKLVAGAFTGKVDISLKTLNKLTSAFSTIQLAKLEKLSDRNKDLSAEYEKLAEEAAAETDTMRGFMNIYAKPATADWSIYASTYDLPYERGGGSMAMGNIQKTTKQALRPTDYQDYTFGNMLNV